MSPETEPHQPPEPFTIARAPRGSHLGRAEVPWTPRGLAGAVAQAALEMIAPPRCAGCGWFSPHLFCEQCAPGVRRVDAGGALCHCCGERFDALAIIAPGTICADCRGDDGEIATPIEYARSLWMLRGPVRLAIHDFKYRRHTSTAASLGAHLGLFAGRDSVLSSAFVVIPVPLHARREWARGFNQSALLAQHVAREMGLPCAPILRRVRHTPSQTALSRPARDANVRAAFQIRPEMLAKYLRQDAPILLIDDVWTTGATLRECARALKKAGAGRVCALTLARRGPMKDASKARV